MNKTYKILYIGALWEGSTCLQRMHCLQQLGHEVTAIDLEPQGIRQFARSFPAKMRRKLFRYGFPIKLKGVAKCNGKIVDLCRTKKFDILWFDKALTIDGETFHSIRSLQSSCVIVGYSGDDMAGRHNQSQQFLNHMREYDIFFTTKSYGVRELIAMGMSRVVFVGNAYDPNTHRPFYVSKKERKDFGGQIGFIGQWEKERADSILFLAGNGLPIRVWGYTWERCEGNHENLKLENRPLWGEDYAKAICSFDINLVFLRKINRDKQTTRSIEIPACGGFMLAERTDEHLDLFEEGKEAEFFKSNEELLEKAKYYVGNPEKRNKIALAGRARCIKGGYSNWDRLNEMLNNINMIQRN